MHRFVLFVDGSNLIGSLRAMNLRVDDYEKFYHYIFNAAVAIWRQSLTGTSAPPAQLFRVNWYAIGGIDQWDLADPKVQSLLRAQFDKDVDLKKTYMALAGVKLPSRPQEEVATEAWSMCFLAAKEWYLKRGELVEGFKRFHHGVRAGTDFIDVIECGRWKVDLLHRTVTEKGLDTRMAVDMVTSLPNYDVGIVVSGDADSIPSVEHVKAQGKHVGVVEFLGGYPPEKKGATFSSRLKVAADFVVQSYEMDLVSKGMATKAST